MTNWQFISSPPGWWAFYYNGKSKIALPIVAWRLKEDNRFEDDQDGDPDNARPYGEPLIQAGDGTLESCFGQGNYYTSADGRKSRYDFRDWVFDEAEYIPKIKGILKKPQGDCIYWEVL